MSFWYNKKDDEKVANLSCTNWNEVNSKFEFDELGFTFDDTFYLIVALATKFSDCMKMGEKDFSLTEQLVKFKIARKDYTKKDWKTKQDVRITQSRTEKWLCQTLESLDETKRYKGFLHLQDGNFIDNFLTGKDSDGKEIPSDTLQLMATSYKSLEEVDEEKVTSDLLSIPVSKSYGGYSKGQTEKERLTDKVSFAREMMKDIWDINDQQPVFKLLVEALQQGDDKAIYFLQVLEKF